MELLKAADEWIKDEMSSALVFILIGIIFLIGTVFFWHYGKTEVAKAFIIPMLIAGLLLLMAGVGFYFSNTKLLNSYEHSYATNALEFIDSELVRTEKTISSYQNVALKVFPGIIILASLLIIFFKAPTIRAISITAIAFLVTLMLMDMNALSRIEKYHAVLEEAKKQI